MKWFKHDTDGNRSDKMAFIFAEFGLEGYARWIIMLEEVGAEMDETDNTSLTLPVTEWCKRLRSRPKPLLKLLGRLQDVMKDSDFSATIGGRSCSEVAQKLLRSSEEKQLLETTDFRSLTISIPNLLRKRDDTSRKVRNRSGKSHSQSVEREVDKEEELRLREEARVRDPVDNSNRNGKTPPASSTQVESKSPEDTGEDFIDQVRGFLDQTAEILTTPNGTCKLSENDVTGLRCDLVVRGSMDGLDDLLYGPKSLNQAKQDGRLWKDDGLKNPVGWLRNQIRARKKPP